MAEQSGVALETALRAMRAVADLGEAIASAAYENGVSATAIVGAYSYYAEMIEATWPPDGASDEMRALIERRRSSWDGLAESEDHEDANPEG